MADFELKIIGDLSELADIAQRFSGIEPTGYAAPITDNDYVAPAANARPYAAPAEAPKRTRKKADEAAPVPTQTADAASPADTGASPTEASSSAGSATDASPSPTPAPESITHPDQLLGSAVTPDMLKDAMTDALSKRQIPAAKVQGALKEATGGVASLSALWALPDDADRAAKATAAYAALTGLTA